MSVSLLPFWVIWQRFDTIVRITASTQTISSASLVFTQFHSLRAVYKQKDREKGPAPLLASNIWPCDLWITQSFSLIGPTVWNSFLLDLWSTKSFPLVGPTVWNSFLLDLLSTKSFSLIGPTVWNSFLLDLSSTKSTTALNSARLWKYLLLKVISYPTKLHVLPLIYSCIVVHCTHCC